MRLIFVMSFLFAGSVSAQTLGCFSLNETPTVCANNGYICAPTFEGDVETAGVLVAGLCRDIRETYADAVKCTDDYNDLVDSTNAVMSRQSRLISRLRKACGSKCKKIK